VLVLKVIHAPNGRILDTLPRASYHADSSLGEYTMHSNVQLKSEVPMGYMAWTDDYFNTEAV
jgi:hypothetical protein